jgi:hypothetical protein
MAVAFKWFVSVVWTILIVPVLVLVWRGVLDRGDVANHPVDWAMGWLASFAQVPGIYPSALIATGLVAGVWIDWFLKRVDGSRARRRELLGLKYCSLAYDVAGQLDSSIVQWPQNIHHLRPALMSAFIEAEGFGVWAPVNELDAIEAGGVIMVNYLRVVGTMLEDGHFRQAKMRALEVKNFVAQQSKSVTSL